MPGQLAFVDGEAQVREPAEQGAQGEGPDEPGQVGARAVVRAGAERQVGGVVGAQPHENDRTGGDHGAVDLHVVQGETPGRDRERNGAAEQVVDGAVVAEPLAQLRITEQLDRPGDHEHGDGGDAAREQAQCDRDQFLGRETALAVGRQQMVQQAVRIAVAALAGEETDPPVLQPGLRGAHLRVVGMPAVDPGQGRGGQGFPVGGRDAEGVRGGPDREGTGVSGDQIGGLTHRVQQLVAGLFERIAQARGLLLGQARGQHVAQPPVIGAVAVEQVPSLGGEHVVLMTAAAESVGRIGEAAGIAGEAGVVQGPAGRGRTGHGEHRQAAGQGRALDGGERHQVSIDSGHRHRQGREPPDGRGQVLVPGLRIGQPENP